MIKGDFQTIVTKLFDIDENGYIRFGYASQSLQTTEMESFLGGLRVEFRDYIMEGFVNYYLKIERIDLGMLLWVEKKGMNRDKYIISAIKHYLKHEGKFEFECESC